MKKLQHTAFTVISILLTAVMLTFNPALKAANISGSDKALGSYNEGINYADMSDMHEIIIDENDIVKSDNLLNASDITDTKLSSIYNSSWDKYTTYYFYNQLSSEKKELWDRIDALAASYLDGSHKSSDVGTVSGMYAVGEIVCTTDGTSRGSAIFSSVAERKNFFTMFRMKI